VSEADDLLNKIKEITDGLGDRNSAIYDAYANPTTKRDMIINWGNHLERLHELGIYQEPIHTISAHISSKLRSMDLPTAVFWAREVLPFKYKDDSMNRYKKEDELTSEVKPRKNSSDFDFKKSNVNYLKRITNTIETLTAVKKLLETKVELESLIDEDELTEFFIRWDQSTTKLNETLSDKNMVMPSNAHYLIFAHSITTLNHVYSHYIKHVKEFAYITGKQAGKIAKGKVTKLQLLFEPKDRNESLEAGFYGQPCDECGSWRTEYRATNDNSKLFLFCFACKKFSKHKTEIIKQ
jgi:hypothetical protein